MTSRSWLRFILLLALALAPSIGCGDDDAPVDADASTDAASLDAAPPLECSFPSPALGTSATARALAAAPERCGQAAHTWLDDPSLGDVLAHERVQRISASLLQAAIESQGITSPRPLEHDVVIDQLLYLTQDRGSLIEATAAVAYPAAGFDDPGPRDIILVLHGTAGFSDACAPSSDITGQALAALFASFGYLAIAPDYIGLKGIGDPTGFIHPYLVGQATAIASLDSVRALAKLEAAERGDTCVAPRVLVFGGSQGGHAALWVDRLSDTYAPELELLGTVATVPPADVFVQATRGLTTLVDATGNTVAMFGAAAGWYGVQDRLDEVFLSPYDTEVPAALALSCTADAPPTPDVTALDEFIQPAILDAVAAGTFADVDPWGCLIAENGLITTSIPRTREDSESYGILMTFGGADELVHTPIERESYRTLCEAGVPVQMLECEGAGHLEGTFFALPEILDFMDARLAGEPFTQPSCEPPGPVVCRGTP